MTTTYTTETIAEMLSRPTTPTFAAIVDLKAIVRQLLTQLKLSEDWRAEALAERDTARTELADFEASDKRNAEHKDLVEFGEVQ